MGTVDNCEVDHNAARRSASRAFEVLFKFWNFVIRPEFLNQILGQKMSAVGAIVARAIEFILPQYVLKRRYTIHNI